MYNSGSTGLNSVRMETGNILPEDFPDTEITINIENAYSKVQLAAGRTLTNPFATTDTEYGLAREIEKKEAAKNCLKAYGPEFRDKVEELDKEVIADMTFLKENMQVAPGPEADIGILMAVTPYTSYGAAIDEDPAQTTISPYRSGITSGCCSTCGCSQASNLCCCS